MLKIRLTRLGAKKAPFYRIVVADARAPREGRPVDTIGQYDATKQPAIVNVDEEKALAWLINREAYCDDRINFINCEIISEAA